MRKKIHSYSRAILLSDTTGLIIAVVIGILFGYWFAFEQVHAVSSSAELQYYPDYAFMLTVVECALAVTAIAVLSHLMLSYATFHKLPAVITALTFLPVLMVYMLWTMWCIAILIVVFQMLVLLAVWRKPDYLKLKLLWGGDLAVLIMFILLHMFLTTGLSPLHTKMPVLDVKGVVSEEIQVVAPIYREYVLSKQFNFSSIDYASWGAVMHPSITLHSTLLQLVAWITDKPSISVEAFHAILLAINFFLIVAGSFGCYLFLKYALRLHPVFAFTGGALMFLSGYPLLDGMFEVDGGVFLSPFALFPYALLFISLAMQKRDYVYALLAGMALASQFFFFAPHPEGTIYSILWYGIFTTGLCFFCGNGRESVKARTLLATVSGIAFILLSAYTLFPMLWDTLSGNMYTFPHTQDIGSTPLKAHEPYIWLLVVFFFLSTFLLWRQKRGNPVHASLLFLSMNVFVFAFAISHIQFNQIMVRYLHIGLHYSGEVPWRIGLYVFLCALWLGMVVCDGVAATCLRGIKTKWPYLLE